MPGDTKIKRTTKGWYDVDNPSVYYPARRYARDARRGTPVVFKSKPTVTGDQTNSARSLSGLQKRLYERLIYRQGVTTTEALAVIMNNPYNKAASYGHMRAAGANHSEALTVIDLGSPAVSLAYGQHRAVGYQHTDALRDAIIIGGMDDDGF